MPVYRGKRPLPQPPLPCQNVMPIARTETALKPPTTPVGQSATPAVRTPQARILNALMPGDDTDPVFDWPLVTRPQLAVRAGYTAISGTVTRALNGLQSRTVRGDKPRTGNWKLVGVKGGKEVWEGSTSGDPYPGLLEQKLVEEVVLDIEGTKETNYRITRRGITAYQMYAKKYGALPQLRDASICTNNRYLKPEQKQEPEPTKDSLHPEGL